MRNAANLVGLKIGWWACVLGAAAGNGIVGPVIVLVHLAAHFALSTDRSAELRIIGAAVGLGYILDSGLTAAGALAFGDGDASVAPIWMAALWANFGTSVNGSLRVLVGRPLIASAVGAVAGPLAYWGGARFGAIALPLDASLPAVAVEYAIALPVLFGVAARGDRSVARIENATT